MKILSTNQKTGYSLNFPIEQTCDKACPFYQNRTCYGLKNRFVMPNYVKAENRRWDLFCEHPETFFDRLADDIKKAGWFIRINGIGDTPDEATATRLAHIFSESKAGFWIATRKLFWSTIDLSANVTVRYSDGVEGDLTSGVVTEGATCPATVKSSGVHTCKECGHKCWSVQEKHIAYGKH